MKYNQVIFIKVLRLRGTIPRTQPWDVMCDLYFFREPEEIEKDEQASVMRMCRSLQCRRYGKPVPPSHIGLLRIRFWNMTLQDNWQQWKKE